MSDLARHPWITGNLRVPRAVLDQVDAEARRAYAADEESCGFLVGPAGDARALDGIVPMVNRANKLHAPRSRDLPAHRAHLLRHRLDEVRRRHPQAARPRGGP